MRPTGSANEETSRLHLSHVTRFLAACLLTISVVTDAAAQRRPAPVSPSAAARAQAPGGQAPGGQAPVAPILGAGAIQSINVTGNQRIEAGTIRSYMLVRPGDPFDSDRLDRSLKTLFSTGLFQDVQLSRDGGALTVKVVENPLVNRVVFEGNTDTLTADATILERFLGLNVGTG